MAIKIEELIKIVNGGCNKDCIECEFEKPNILDTCGTFNSLGHSAVIWHNPVKQEHIISYGRRELKKLLEKGER